MTTQKITIHIYTRIGEYDKPGNMVVFSTDMRNNPSCMKDMKWLCEQEVEVDIPDYDPVQAQIEDLERQIEIEQGRSAAHINMLKDRIGKLLAIGQDT